MKIVTRAVWLLFALPAIAHAQVDLRARVSNPIRFTGEIGSLGELYSVSGGEQRRPSSTGRLYMRSNLQLFASVSVNFDLLYSTESGSDVMLGSTGRQSLNQIGISPQWRWGRAYLGSFHDSYSSLTYDAIGLRGAGAFMNPGLLRIGAFTGRAQSAVAGGAMDGAYRRRMTGGRIGIGRGSEYGGGSYFDVVMVRTADDPASLPSPASIDEPNITGMVNPYAVTPEENVVLAAVTRIPLQNERLVVSGEVAGSIYSRDRRAPLLSDEALDEYSKLLRSFITPRASTYGDIAHKAQLELRNLPMPGSSHQSPRSLSASFGYRYIGAGYVSLGVASLPADQLAFNAQTSVRFRTWTASIQGMHQEDNLIGLKLATTTRNRLGISASVRPTQALNTSVRASISMMENDAADAAQRMDFTSYTLGLTQSINLPQGGAFRAMAVGYSYQQTGDASPLRAANGLRAHDASVRATLAVSRNINVLPSVGFAISDIGGAGWTIRHTYALAGQHRTQGGRLTSSVSLANSRLHAGGSVQAAITTRYRLTQADQVALSVRNNRVTGLETATGGFREYMMSIQWSRVIR